MESIFTLAYPEYSIAEKLHKLFPKKKGYAILAPLSRQQKGFDLAIYNLRKKNAVTIQVKASRAYMDNPLTRKRRRDRFDNHFWYRVFDYEPENADFFFFFGLYVKPNFVGKKLNRAKSFNKYWDAKVIVYSDSEMKDFLKRLRTKRGKKESLILLLIMTSVKFI